MMGQQRRILPRQLADWPGRLTTEDGLEAQWHDCRVVDVSTAGAGIELTTDHVDDLQGRRVVMAVYLSGEVRHQTATAKGRQRLGLQFVDLSDEERSYLMSLETIGAVW